jgi:hypothetical protein
MFTKKQYWDLFWFTAFPIHAWAYYVMLRQGDWVSHRSGLFDALGLFSYGALTALVESNLVFALLFVLSFLLPARWHPKQRLSVLGGVVVLFALAAITDLWFFNLDRSIGTFAFRVTYNLNRFAILTLPLLVLGLVTAVIVLLWLARNWPIFVESYQGLAERTGLLGWLYLFVDMLGLGVILVRNL